MQTRHLRDALENAVRQLTDAGTPEAASAAADLTTLLEALAPPPETYPELEEMDEAICEALQSFTALCLLGDDAELRQTLKTLRRILLSDRRRLDPDPDRHALDVAVALRQLWLIGHRSGLLTAIRQRENTLAMLARLTNEAARAELQDHLAVLDQYLAAQEGYGSSLRQELQQLQAQRLQ